jgi:hypothetical protein
MCLKTEGKARKNLSQGSQRDSKYTHYQDTLILQNPHTNTHTRTHTHTHTLSLSLSLRSYIDYLSSNGSTVTYMSDNSSCLYPGNGSACGLKFFHYAIVMHITCECVFSLVTFMWYLQFNIPFFSFVCSRQSSVQLLPTKHRKMAPAAEGWVHYPLFRVQET